MSRRTSRPEASFETELYRPLPPGVEYADGETEVMIEVAIYGTYEPYVPAKTYGPPENCYPAEGGYAEDVTAIFMDGDKERVIPLTDDEVADFSDRLAETAMEDEQARYEDAMEARGEAQRDREGW